MSRTQYVKISDSAKEELRNARIEGNILHLDGQVKNYAELKKVFAQIGVVWKKKEKHHVLETGAQDQIDFILNGGKIVDEKKTLQAFYTPIELVERIVELADVRGKWCLEPSCGDGRIIREMCKAGAVSVEAYDINPKALDVSDFDIFNSDYTRVRIGLGVDFLKVTACGIVNCVVMNPPYDNNTWVKHIEHAWKFLCEGDKLVAICPNNESKLAKFLHNTRDYNITPIEAGAFKESGTMIATMILEVWK